MSSLFGSPLSVVSVGLEEFAKSLRSASVAVQHLDWRPSSLESNVPVATHLAIAALSADPNAAAVQALLDARPQAIGVAPAGELVPELRDGLVLHAGPPIAWEEMCGPLRGAVVGALMFEGHADNPEQAERLAASAAVDYAPNHHYGIVGPMAGVTTAHMPLWIVENRTTGGRAYSGLNEGLGAVLRYGAYGDEVIERLHWMAGELGPLLDAAIRKRSEPVDIRSLVAQAVAMGDEVHNRNRAATSLTVRLLAPEIVRVAEADTAERMLRFLAGNDHFFLNLSMAAAKVTADAARGIDGATIVTCMARNGTEFGIQIAGLDGKWFTGPAGAVDGLYFPGYGADDAARDIGDSVITETVGLGGFAMAAAPAIVQFVGGQPADAVRFTESMYSITAGEHDEFRIPALGFRGTPTGIDILRVLDTGTLPIINTGIAHRTEGVGMIGAGLVRPPAECFAKALDSYVQRNEQSLPHDIVDP